MVLVIQNNMDISDDEYDPTTESQKNKTTTIKNKSDSDNVFFEPY